jgi:hypothetical protein
MVDMESALKFNSSLILKKLNRLGTVHVTDFANDLDYTQGLKYTRKGPNSLGRVDKHKVGIAHRQLHPSMIGIVDLMDSTKDVGQTGMISPWADISVLSECDINKYPNIKYELFDYIRNNFSTTLRFNCNTLEEYNNILDSLIMFSRLDVDYKILQNSSEDIE